MITLTGVHPTLIEKVKQVQAAMAALGHPMKVIQAVRSTAQQQALYAQGRTTPGKIVTNCDGVKLKSNHQPKPDGFGHAVDMAFEGLDPFGEHQPWAMFGSCARHVGLVWGGDWKSLVDRPHVELPYHKG